MKTCLYCRISSRGWRLMLADWDDADDIVVQDDGSSNNVEPGIRFPAYYQLGFRKLSCEAEFNRAHLLALGFLDRLSFGRFAQKLADGLLDYSTYFIFVDDFIDFHEAQRENLSSFRNDDYHESFDNDRADGRAVITQTAFSLFGSQMFVRGQ